jgi:predicted regulator of amino acid metabolism with ACT domain
MWEAVANYFDRYPGQRKVANYIMDNGLCVQGGNIFLDKIKVSKSEVARVVGVDKRVVTSTMKTIMSEPQLAAVFSKLKPSCSLVEVASEMGWDVLAITLSDPAIPGVLGNVAQTIGNAGVSIRQAIGEDPMFTSGLLYVVTETAIPGHIINEIKHIQGVKTVTLM